MTSNNRKMSDPDNSPKPELPTAIDSVHRKVLDCVQDTVSAIRQYRHSRLGWTSEDVKKCLDFMRNNEKVDIAGMQVEKGDRISSKLDKWMKGKEEVALIGQLKDEKIGLMNVLYAIKRLGRCKDNHLYKYCLSLQGLLGDDLINITPKYEKRIVKFRSNIDEGFEKLAEPVKEIKSKAVLIGEWLNEFERVTELTQEICDTALKIVEEIRGYIKADQQYPNDLYTALTRRSRERSRKEKKRSKIENSKDALLTDLDKKRKILESSQHHLNQLKIETKHDRSSREILKLRLERSEQDMSEKLDSLKDAETLHNKLKSKIKPKKYNEETTLHLYKQSKNELIERRLGYEKSEGKYRSCERQLGRLERREQEGKERMYEAEMEVEEGEQACTEAQNLLEDNRAEVEQLTERIDVLTREMDYLQAMRDLKLSPDTLRRVYKTGSPALKSRSKEFKNACKLISAEIGDDWQQLYMKLPFLPRRHRLQRRRDVITVDAIYGSLRYDMNQEGQAEQSLLKWKQFTPRGSVSDLVQGLRRLEKYELAGRVEDLAGIAPQAQDQPNHETA